MLRDPIHSAGRFEDARASARSGFRQIDTVVHCVLQFLLAAEISLGRLHRNVSKQKLNLLQFSSGQVT